MARTPDEIWSEIADLKHGVADGAPYRETMHGLADHNFRLADLWSELLEAIPAGTPGWTVSAARVTADHYRDRARQQRKDAER